MLMLLFLVLSLPIAGFALWFGWKAHQAGKPNVVRAMAWLAFLALTSALLTGFWAYAMWAR